jgi:hypothetical protein
MNRCPNVLFPCIYTPTFCTHVKFPHACYWLHPSDIFCICHCNSINSNSSLCSSLSFSRSFILFMLNIILKFFNHCNISLKRDLISRPYKIRDLRDRVEMLISNSRIWCRGKNRIWISEKQWSFKISLLRKRAVKWVLILYWKHKYSVSRDWTLCIALLWWKNTAKCGISEKKRMWPKMSLLLHSSDNNIVINDVRTKLCQCKYHNINRVLSVRETSFAILNYETKNLPCVLRLSMLWVCRCLSTGCSALWTVIILSIFQTETTGMLIKLYLSTRCYNPKHICHLKVQVNSFTDHNAPSSRTFSLHPVKSLQIQ